VSSADSGGRFAHRLRAELAMVIVEHNLDLMLALGRSGSRAQARQRRASRPAEALRENLELRSQVLWM
jgi:hypothetical protein